MLKFLTEKEIWHAFQLGNRDAFEEILKRHYSPMLNYGNRLVQNKDFAYDCLQDFFIELWNRRQHLSIPESTLAYLLSSYKRRLLKEKNKIFFSKSLDWVIDDHDFEVQFSIETYLINNEIEHETLLRLKKELDLLSKRQREALYLRFYQELEYTEISKIMDINTHSTVNLVYEALKVLRKNWVM